MISYAIIFHNFLLSEHTKNNNNDDDDDGDTLSVFLSGRKVKVKLSIRLW